MNVIEKKNVSERSDTHFNGRYELTHKYRSSWGSIIACTAYNNFYRDGPPIPKRSLERALRLNPIQFNEQNYVQTYETAMGTKMSVAFANIFMAQIETQILDYTANKPLVWKRYINDLISLLHTNRDVIKQFIK